MDELEQLAALQQGANGRPPLEDVTPRTLAEVVAGFEERLYLPAPGIVLVTLGAYAANLLDGDPVWAVIVGPPSSGKTEVLQSTRGLRDVHAASTLTEPALLSGTSRKEHAANARGGLLKEIGDFGVLVCKDLTSILSMRKDTQAEVLGALREIYDGAYTRHVGTDGGKTLHWSGKMGLLAGCTETIDRRHGVMAAMGERFTLFRPESIDADKQVQHAFDFRVEMRQELQELVAGLFCNGLPAEPLELGEDDRDRLRVLATFAVRCRSAVERDSFSGTIELVPQSELPARFARSLARILAGLDAIGLDRGASWPLVVKLALDSIPALRLAVIEALRCGGELATDVIGVVVRHPTQTTRRALEDLEAHGLLERDTAGKAHKWTLSAWCAERYARALEIAGESVPDIPSDVVSAIGAGTVPDIPTPNNSLHHTLVGKTGKETGEDTQTTLDEAPVP